MKDKNKKSPFNTSEEFKREPLFGLLAAMGENGRGIEAQEAQGQQSFVGSDTLPKEIRSYGNYDAKAILKKFGVKFLGPVPGDSLFQYVELPSGWQKVSTDHPMWSMLVDDQGRPRAQIFYKAAFYDRDANMSLKVRFHVEEDWARNKREGVVVYKVVDCGQTVYTTEPLRPPADERKGYEVHQQARAAAEAWLEENYPGWKDPGAYWD